MCLKWYILSGQISTFNLFNIIIIPKYCLKLTIVIIINYNFVNYPPKSVSNIMFALKVRYSNWRHRICRIDTSRRVWLLLEVSPYIYNNRLWASKTVIVKFTCTNYLSIAFTTHACCHDWGELYELIVTIMIEILAWRDKPYI